MENTLKHKGSATLFFANETAGAGHRARTTSVSRMLEKQGFCSKIKPIPTGITGAGITNYILESNVRDHIIFIDSYELSPKNILDLTRSIRNLVVFDDYFAFANDQILRINAGPHAKKIGADKLSRWCAFGLDYYISQDEFQSSKRNYFNSNVTNIVISLGFNPSQSVLCEVCRQLEENFPSSKKFLMAGSLSSEVLNRLGRHSSKLSIARTTTVAELSKIYSQADMAICNAGQTMLEFASLGVPNISITLAQNQFEFQRAVAELSLTVPIESQVNLRDDLKNALAYVGVEENRNKMSNRLSRINLSKGGDNLYKLLMEYVER